MERLLIFENVRGIGKVQEFLTSYLKLKHIYFYWYKVFVSIRNNQVNWRETFYIILVQRR